MFSWHRMMTNRTLNSWWILQYKNKLHWIFQHETLKCLEGFRCSFEVVLDCSGFFQVNNPKRSSPLKLSNEEICKLRQGQLTYHFDILQDTMDKEPEALGVTAMGQG